MSNWERLDFLRELNAVLRGAAERLEDGFLSDLGLAAEDCQVERLRLTRDAVQRARRQVGHLTAALLLGPFADRFYGPDAGEQRKRATKPNQRVDGQ